MSWPAGSDVVVVAADSAGGTSHRVTLRAVLAASGKTSVVDPDSI